jgi:DNA-binding transcriptional MerR regulator
MYIGELARLSGCTAKAIRLYEQLGQLTPQHRGSYRLYMAHHLTRVQMIRTAQAVGFKLWEIRCVPPGSRARSGLRFGPDHGPWRARVAPQTPIGTCDQR